MPVRHLETKWWIAISKCTASIAFKFGAVIVRSLTEDISILKCQLCIFKQNGGKLFQNALHRLHSNLVL